MRRFTFFAALSGLLAVAACTGAQALTGPGTGSSTRLQDGTDPGSNNHHSVVRLFDRGSTNGTDPGSNNGCSPRC
jgi:hypothetical protein